MTAFGKINGTDVLKSGTVIVVGSEQFEFEFQNAIYAVSFENEPSAIGHKAYAKVIDNRRMLFTFHGIENQLGFSAAFSAGKLPEGELTIRFFVSTVGTKDETSRVVNYTLILQPKVS